MTTPPSVADRRRGDCPRRLAAGVLGRVAPWRDHDL